MRSGAPFSHVLITRFNIRVPCGERPTAEWKPPSKEWMLHRLDLFERYCLPSVASQSVQNFHWILLVDPNTPAEFMRS
jgi:hypothetical protein